MYRFLCFLVVQLLFISNMTMPLPVSAAGQVDNISKCPDEDIKEARRSYAQEQVNIARAAGRVVRKALRLEIHTRNRVVIFEDDCTNGESYGRYTFEAHFADSGYFLIAVTAWEGSGYFLINDQTGKKTAVEGRPVFSPNRKRFVAMSMDLEAGYDSNSIQIWQLDPAGAKLEYRVDAGTEWGPSDPVWKDNLTIQFKKNVLIEPGGKYQSSAALLVQKGNTWEVE